MFKRFLLRQYIRFLTNSKFGGFINFFGKTLFGKITFITGYDSEGIEFYKTTTSRSVDKVHAALTGSGHTELDEHTDVDSLENALKSLAMGRRKTKSR